MASFHPSVPSITMNEYHTTTWLIHLFPLFSLPKPRRIGTSVHQTLPRGKERKGKGRKGNERKEKPSSTISALHRTLRIISTSEHHFIHAHESFASSCTRRALSCRIWLRVEADTLKLVSKGIEDEQAECIIASATALLLLQIQVKVGIRPRGSFFEF